MIAELRLLIMEFFIDLAVKVAPRNRKETKMFAEFLNIYLETVNPWIAYRNNFFKKK